VSEICETGEQGGLTVGLWKCQYTLGWEHLLRVMVESSTHTDELPNEKATLVVTIVRCTLRGCKDGK